MTVHLEFKQNVSTVYETLTDSKFLIDRNLALGELSAECEVESSKCTATIHSVREVRRSLPGLLAKIFDPVNVMDMEENWQADGSGWVGDWTLAVRGQPITIRGDFKLKPKTGGCRYSVSHRATAGIPFLRGQVEKFILSHTRQGANDELEYLRNHLESEIT